MVKKYKIREAELKNMTQSTAKRQLRPCLVHPKTKKISRFHIILNLGHMREALDIDENKN